MDLKIDKLINKFMIKILYKIMLIDSDSLINT